ncbi:MAG: hypothetical protein HRT66_09370, partial [Flavobacteriaceae bacterium]|nr:hypothetical protein [Flavobacteriaceae bacterium]
MKNSSLILILFFFLLFNSAFAQIGIGTEEPSEDSILDVFSSTKGVVLPRVHLKSIKDSSPMNTHVVGMIVYNLSNLLPIGYYYNDGSKWIRFSQSEDGLSKVTTIKIADAAVTDVKIASNIDAVKLADGSVSNTEFQYLGAVTSDIQTQLDGKLDLTGGTVTGTTTIESDLTLGKDGTTGVGTIVLLDNNPNNSNKITIKSPAAVDTSYILILPADAGVDGEVLKTDGNGVLSWVTPSITGLTSGQITLLSNTSGENTGDQDISGIATNATDIS